VLNELTEQTQARKYTNLGFDEDDDDELDEESLLETPLDDVEPYSLFKQCLLSMSPFCYTVAAHY